jgi:hypothetical protein
MSAKGSELQRDMESQRVALVSCQPECVHMCVCAYMCVCMCMCVHVEVEGS